MNEREDIPTELRLKAALRPITDADRWAYVRDNLTRTEPKMNGQHYFFLRNPRGRGRSLEEVIDNLIRESRGE